MFSSGAHQIQNECAGPNCHGRQNGNSQPGRGSEYPLPSFICLPLYASVDLMS